MYEFTEKYIFIYVNRFIFYCFSLFYMATLKKKSLNVIIPLVIYPFEVMFSVGQTDKELKGELDKFGCNWSDLLILPPTGLGRTVMTDSNHTIIRFNEWPVTCKQYGTLAHEIFHAVDFIFRRIGMTLSEDSDESYAYMIGYLTEEIYKKINL